MLHRLNSRRAWLVASVVAATVIVATAAASTRTSSASTETLVLDKSFDLKTADPQRQFRGHGRHRGARALRHSPQVRGQRRGPSATLGGDRLQGNERSEDLHLHPPQGRALLGRDAADLEGRRLLVPPVDQPEGQPVLPPRRGHGVRQRPLHGRPQVEGAEPRDPCDRRQRVARSRQLRSREGERRHGCRRSRQEGQGRAAS